MNAPPGLEASHPAEARAVPIMVLIVDDERDNRALLEIMLRPEGYLLLTAESGEEALELLTRIPAPGLILLDVLMPGLDGYQVAAKLKSNPATDQIPIIMITALDDREAKSRGSALGLEHFVSKPVDRAELRACVKQLLQAASRA